MTGKREKAAVAAAALIPGAAWAAPVPVEPLAMMIGGGVSFGLGSLFGLWVCRYWCRKREERDPRPDRAAR